MGQEYQPNIESVSYSFDKIVNILICKSIEPLTSTISTKIIHYREMAKKNYPVVFLAENFKAWKVEKLCLNDFFLKVKINKKSYSPSQIVIQWDSN